MKCEESGTEYEELFIGVIDKRFMKDFFRVTGISPSEYFDFFKQYISTEQYKPKDLGKWNKLKFLGFEGPAEDGAIPSNIRQEVKLWEKFREDSDED